MRQDSYASLVNGLHAVGLTAQQSGPDQLIVSVQQGPVWPDRRNSFWLSLQSGTWYLSTWLPACYRIPPNADVVAVCSACMKSSSSAMYQVPDAIVAHFGLERISDNEFERLFPGDGNSSTVPPFR